MKEYKFKTNINCSSCVSKVSTFLNSANGIEEWAVDTSGKDKMLRVKTTSLSEEEIVATVKKAGYQVEGQ